ncbi:hypothetical protein RJ640_020476 [Escallonia rubra]|uniref:Peptidase S9A N-terminal domain-containing protein n=1 Tax=Escallonia rubra TaxID=112253 RepID=A0AA88R120_9ASTE|nr:hypothetical protein RJ640_020476 [Escallonia rubra]
MGSVRRRLPMALQAKEAAEKQRTTKDAPKYKLVRVDLKEPSSWTEVLQETEEDVLESAIAVNGDQMVMSNLSDVKHVLQKRNLETCALLHHLPIEIGSVYDLEGESRTSDFDKLWKRPPNQDYVHCVKPSPSYTGSNKSESITFQYFGIDIRMICKIVEYKAHGNGHRLVAGKKRT